MKHIKLFEEFVNVIRINEGNESTLLFFADELEDVTGFKVASPSYNPKNDNLVIYPGSNPRENFHEDKSSQRIVVKLIGGNFYLQSIVGYSEGIEIIAQQLDEKPGNSGLAGYSTIMLKGNGIKTTPTKLKSLGDLMNNALKNQAKAARDFYKNWKTPD